MSKAAELAALIGSQTALSNRNLVINGNMEVAQRGTSQTASGYGSIDRFELALSGATATMSQESFTVGQTDVPGSEKYLKCDVTTGNNNAGVYHKVEAASVFPAIGGKVTLSYYAKGTSPTDGLQVLVAWYDGSSGANATAETVTLTSSWVKYTHTFTTPDITGLSLTNANARLEISWLQKSTDTGTAAFEVNLAQVQLEVGEQATPFEHRSFGDELIRCQRYFERSYQIGTATGAATQSGAKMFQMASSATILYPSQQNFNTVKRAAPTMVAYSTSDGLVDRIRDASAGENKTVSSFSNMSATSTGNVNISSSSTSGRQYIYHWTADAEL